MGTSCGNNRLRDWFSESAAPLPLRKSAQFARFSRLLRYPTAGALNRGNGLVRRFRGLPEETKICASGDGALQDGKGGNPRIGYRRSLMFKFRVASACL